MVPQWQIIGVSYKKLLSLPYIFLSLVLIISLSPSQQRWKGFSSRLPSSTLDSGFTSWQWLNPLPHGNTVDDVEIIDSNSDVIVSDSSGMYGSGSNVFLDFYQSYLSPIKGGNRCPMYPSCSQYAKILFDSVPIYSAFTGTCERLLRCGHELHLYPQMTINNRIKWYDPPFLVASDEASIHENGSSKFITNQFQSLSQVYEPDSNESAFADYLFTQKEYSRASTEYMRLGFNATDSSKQLHYLSKIGLCYFFGEDYDGYEKFMEVNRMRFESMPTLMTEMYFILSKSYYHQKKYQKAISTIEWSNIQQNNPLYDEAQFGIGLSYARMFQWEKASKYFSQINPTSHRGTLGKLLADSITLGYTLSSRKPWIAGALSAIVPGSGYVYAGRSQTGVASFIINILLIWSVRDAIKHESYGLASAIGFFGIGWYVGNISGSSKAAAEYNTRVKDNFIKNLIKENVIDDF